MFEIDIFYFYVISFLVLMLILSLYYCIKFALIIVRVQDSIENSLDILDNSYSNISSILETPLFFDSPEVRRIMNELENSKDALLYIANDLTNYSIKEDVEPNDRNEN